MAKQTTIPLLPDSIAAALNPNILDFLIELKYLLLFFDRPNAILSTSGLDFINPEVIDDVKHGRKTKTNLFDNEQNIHPLKLLSTDEWAETLAECELDSFKIEVGSHASPFSSKEVDDIFRVTGEGIGLNGREIESLFLRMDKLKKAERTVVFGEFVLRLEMFRLLQILDRCDKQRIPMMWQHIAEMTTCDLYTKYLLKRQLDSTSDLSVCAAIRKVMGGRLLHEILQLNVINVATVPVQKIITFRRKNRDLLDAFLTSYRSFLADVQMDPKNVDRIVQSHTQRIVQDLNRIDNEIAILKQQRGYTWLKRMAEGTYEGAMKGTSIATWNFLAGPLAVIIMLARVLKPVGRALAAGALEHGPAQHSLLMRSSTGYLWKAKHALRSNRTTRPSR